MFTLSQASIQRGYEAILHHGYSDFFPTPPEWAVVRKGWDVLRPQLAKVDLTEYVPFKPVVAFAPKSKINLRPVALLHPIDLIIYTSMVADLVPVIAEHRIPANEKTVFSFRAENAAKDALYAPRPSHAEFEMEKVARAGDTKTGYMGFADIADFYPRLYQHKVRGALDGCVAAKPKLTSYPALIEKLLRGLTHDGLSYGIPIGPAASRPLAEAALLDIDNALLSFEISFIRYIDDFVVFAAKREKVEWALRTLGALLEKQHGLSLHAAKTKVVRCSKFLERTLRAESAEDSVESKFARIIERHFYDDDGRSLNDLDEDEKEALDSVDLEEVLEEALDEDETDYKKVAFILERLSSLERADLIEIVLNHLPRLYPVAHALYPFFQNVGPMDPSTRVDCAKKLLAPILATGDEQAPEFYSIWILDLFRSNSTWNQAASVARVFRETESQAVKRYAALALAATGTRSEALSFKDAIHSAEPLTRSALLQASAKLGVDERKYWIKRLNLDWFEEFLVQYS